MFLVNEHECLRWLNSGQSWLPGWVSDYHNRGWNPLNNHWLSCISIHEQTSSISGSWMLNVHNNVGSADLRRSSGADEPAAVLMLSFTYLPHPQQQEKKDHRLQRCCCKRNKDFWTPLIRGSALFPVWTHTGSFKSISCAKLILKPTRTRDEVPWRLLTEI